MAIFEPDFVFCCTCFVSDIFNLGFLGCKKVTKWHVLFTKEIQKRCSAITMLRRKVIMLINQLWDLCGSTYFDTCVCLHYNRATFYQTIIKNEPYPIKKYYSCYWGLKNFWSTFQSLLFQVKTIIDFIILLKMQFAKPKALLMQEILTFIMLNKLLFHFQMLELYRHILVLKFQKVVLV